jgi:hypothetical protein
MLKRGMLQHSCYLFNLTPLIITRPVHLTTHSALCYISRNFRKEFAATVEPQPSQAIKVFYSYAREDQNLRDEAFVIISEGIQRAIFERLNSPFADLARRYLERIRGKM